jgi:flagellar hook-basal body complex protein FliE
MISGSDAFASIERAMQRVRADEDKLTAVMTSIAEQAARLRATMSEDFKQLARIKLDTLQSQPITATLDQAEARALSLIEEGKRAAEALQQKRTDANAALEEARTKKTAAAADAEQAGDLVDTLIAATEARVKTEPGWQAQAKILEACEAIADEADKKADQAEADLAAKRRPYEADEIFIYLWKRGYGTAAYQGGGLVRMLDGWAARLVDYQKYRPNFAMLQEIPLRLRAHAKSKESEVTAERTKLESIERTALIADGIEPLEKTLAGARGRLAAADAAVNDAQNTLKQLDAQYTAEFGAGRGAAYDRAVDVLAQSLAREDLRGLYRDALATPGPEDERVVAHLMEQEKKLKDSDDELAKTRETIRELARRRAELQSARDDARTKGYDQPYAGFGNEGIIEQVIGDIARGVLRSSDLGRVLNDGFTRRFPRSPGGFGGGSWPYSDWGNNSGGFGGGGGIRIRRFPSSGGGSRSGGGGFRTTGSF